MLRRRLVPVAGLCALIGALLVGAPPASAADLGTVTVNADGTYSPSTLSGAVGDTFKVKNNYANTIVVTKHTSNPADTGMVSVPAGNCVDFAQATCNVSPSGETTYTIATIGVVSILAYNSGTSAFDIPIGPLSLGGSSGGDSVDVALVYPTASLNANGGTCTGTMQFTKYQGQNSTVTLPTAQECTRTNYTFHGWARSASATAPDFTSSVPIGDESFTLYAVWRPSGVLVTYDANVGVGTKCLLNGVDVVGDARRTTPTVVAVGSSTASTAPCTPAGHVLEGWRLTGDGTLAHRAGSALTESSGSSVTLFAQWRSIAGIPATITISKADGGAVPSSVAAGSTTAMVVTAKDAEGNPATLSPFEIEVIGRGATFQDGPGFAEGTTKDSAWPDRAGTVDFTLVAGKSGTFTLKVTAVDYPKVTATTSDIKVDAKKTITITGEAKLEGRGILTRISGVTTGLALPARVKCYLGTPGAVKTSTRTDVGADGTFTCDMPFNGGSYFATTADGSVSSDTISVTPLQR